MNSWGVYPLRLGINCFKNIWTNLNLNYMHYSFHCTLAKLLALRSIRKQNLPVILHGKRIFHWSVAEIAFMSTVESYFYTFLNYFFLSFTRQMFFVKKHLFLWTIFSCPIHIYFCFPFLYQSLAKKEIALGLWYWHEVFSPNDSLSFYFFVIWCSARIYWALKFCQAQCWQLRIQFWTKIDPLSCCLQSIFRKSINKQLSKTYALC